MSIASARNEVTIVTERLGPQEPKTENKGDF